MSIRQEIMLEVVKSMIASEKYSRIEVVLMNALIATNTILEE